jgi:hypothetical protein
MLAALTRFALDYSYGNNSIDQVTMGSQGSTLSTGVNLAVILVGSVLVVALAIFAIIAMWRVFVKAGKPGWAAIIPIYNTWLLAEIGGKPNWWGLYPFLGLVPFIGWLAAIVVGIVICIGVAQNFGKSQLFGVLGLGIFGFVGFPMLAFGSATYHPAGGASGPAPVEPPYPKLPTEQPSVPTASGAPDDNSRPASKTL